MAKKILRDMLFEIFLLQGGAWLAVWLTLILLGKTAHPVPTGSIGVSALIIGKHLPYPLWKKVGLVLLYIVILTTPFTILFPQGLLWARQLFLALGLMQLVVAGGMWFFLSDKPQLSWKREVSDD